MLAALVSGSAMIVLPFLIPCGRRFGGCGICERRSFPGDLTRAMPSPVGACEVILDSTQQRGDRSLELADKFAQFGFRLSCHIGPGLLKARQHLGNLALHGHITFRKTAHQSCAVIPECGNFAA